MGSSMFLILLLFLSAGFVASFDVEDEFQDDDVNNEVPDDGYAENREGFDPSNEENEGYGPGSYGGNEDDSAPAYLSNRYYSYQPDAYGYRNNFDPNGDNTDVFGDRRSYPSTGYSRDGDLTYGEDDYDVDSYENLRNSEDVDELSFGYRKGGGGTQQTQT